MLLSILLFAVTDIESTGGNISQGRIMDIAIFVTDGVEITEEYSTLIKPDRKVHRYVSKLTGINDEMLIEAPTFEEEVEKIAKITQGKILVAHNAEFDFGMLQMEFARAQRPFNRRTLCTVEASRALIPEHKSYSLGNLSDDLQIKVENRHRAHGDALATVGILNYLIFKTDIQSVLKFVKHR
jgi:DNA polymerase III subunit epsilon